MTDGHLTDRQRRTLAAAVDRILPSEDGPGATDAAVAPYVERFLQEEAPPQLRSLIGRGLDRLEELSREEHGTAFAASPAAERETALRRLEASGDTWCAECLRRLVLLCLEGYLCHPRRGGNRNQLGWSYIRHRPRGAGSGLEPRGSDA